MGFLKYFSPSRAKHAGKNDLRSPAEFPSPSSNVTKQLSPQLLSRILCCVCPHVLDESYNSSEELTTEDGCMLCDMRDLAHCALVSKKWCMSAKALLYRHVRIDAVHYCELEIALSAKRKRQRSFGNRDGRYLDAPQLRLQLFMKTVRESQELADTVLSLRLPYMTREASKSDLARTISVLRHLQYVDLPVGLFSDDASSYALKQELMVKCPDIRRMAYTHGSERSFSHIPGSKLWINLEILELSGLLVEEGILRQVLNSFPALRSLKIENLPLIGDNVFTPTQSLPMFPSITALSICGMPTITARGLAIHLSMSQNQHALETLVLKQSGVRPEFLQGILSKAPRLKTFTLELNVDKSFSAREVPLLTSRSVSTIRYEIISTSSPSTGQNVASSYYDYLMLSLKSNLLPALRYLYVLDPRFPDMLLLPPPLGLFAGGEERRQSLPVLGPSLQQSLTLYTKGTHEFEWNITRYEPTSIGRHVSSATRPVSFHSAQLSSQWGARQSVIVGNGFGGFLAVPAHDERSASGGCMQTNTRDSKYDMWR